MAQFASRLFTIMHKVEEWLLAWAMMLIAALTVLNVVARTVFDHSLAFAEELTQFLIIVVCFVGLSYAASRGRHIRMTALYDLLPLKPRKILMIVIAAVTALLLFYLAYFSFGYIYVVHELGSVSPTLRVPLSIVFLIVPVGLILAGIQYVLTVVRNVAEPDKVYMSYAHTDEYEPVEGVASGAAEGGDQPEEPAKGHGRL